MLWQRLCNDKHTEIVLGVVIMNAVYLVLVAVIVSSGFADVAEARRNNRDGFNFGTTVKVLNRDDRTNAGIGSDQNTKVSGSSQAVTPHVGYSTGTFNLGLAYSFESAVSESREASEDGQTITERKTDLNGKGLNLYSRFLFGDVFFFEAAGGIYSEKLKVTSERKQLNGDGSFSGDEKTYEVSGVGFGYNVGGGLELAMGNGFYFSSAYQVRIVQLRDHNGGSDLGKKRSNSQKREILFGISYYDR
jgi:hypothetical protein